MSRNTPAHHALSQRNFCHCGFLESEALDSVRTAAELLQSAGIEPLANAGALWARNHMPIYINALMCECVESRETGALCVCAKGQLFNWGSVLNWFNARATANCAQPCATLRPSNRGLHYIIVIMHAVLLQTHRLEGEWIYVAACFTPRPECKIILSLQSVYLCV